MRCREKIHVEEVRFLVVPHFVPFWHQGRKVWDVSRAYFIVFFLIQDRKLAGHLICCIVNMVSEISWENGGKGDGALYRYRILKLTITGLNELF